MMHTVKYKVYHIKAIKCGMCANRELRNRTNVNAEDSKSPPLRLVARFIAVFTSVIKAAF
jgi:hypothetical protein